MMCSFASRGRVFLPSELGLRVGPGRTRAACHTQYLYMLAITLVTESYLGLTSFPSWKVVTVSSAESGTITT